jgi:anaerobic c4-dicarboxylate membrane transporter family protein
MFWVQLVMILALLWFGAKRGGMFLGMCGGIGLGVMVFVFNADPTSPPVDVLMIILAVILAATAMQAAGGLEFLVDTAERLLRKHPSRVTFMAPLVSYIFTFFSGTGHIIYSLLPVIVEVAKESGVRPERPVSISVVAAQHAIPACPISAAMAAMIGFLAPLGVSMPQILGVTLAATLTGMVAGAFAVLRKGAELEKDPVYLRRVAEGLIKPAEVRNERLPVTREQKLSIALFLFGVCIVVLMGVFPEIRPLVPGAKGMQTLGMSTTIEITMLILACVIVLACKVNVDKLVTCSVFQSGCVAIVCCFIVWMNGCFVNAHMDMIKSSVAGFLENNGWLFIVVTFMVSVITSSQFATTAIVMPLGIGLGLSPHILLGAFPAVAGYYFLPIGSQALSAIAFDSTGTTRIGKYLLNHSFMVPGLVTTIVSVIVATSLAGVLL